MSGAWSEKEVQAIVDDYFDMLSLELQGKSFKKSEHREQLLSSIDRSPGSIEYKHQNISAVLIELGLPYIAGYKPAWNYQKKILPTVILDYLASNPQLTSLVELDVYSQPVIPTVQSILNSMVSPPPPRAEEEGAGYSSRPTGKVNYLAKEADNASLGAAGEEFVINYEKARLVHAGESNLADRIERVSMTNGDSEGYDILSFNTDGSDRFIEAKTTRYGIHTPFFVTSNEVKFSERNRDRYHLYRVFEFRENPKIFTLGGFIGDAVKLEPQLYVGKI